MKKDAAADPRLNALNQRLKWGDLDVAYLRQLIDIAREEDLEGAGLRSLPRHPGDATTALLEPDTHGTATLVLREDALVCGLPLVPLVLARYGAGAQFKPLAQDGAHLPAGSALGALCGPIGILLQAERVLLNFLQHLGGVATQTARYVAALGESPTRLLDTRKTTPGFRVLEKYAVACGGGWNHRMGLYDRVMLKDNHLAVCAGEAVSLKSLVERSRNKQADLLVEIEVDTLAQVPVALEAGADVIMLDNFSFEALQKALDLIGDKAYTEASGGITLKTLPQLGSLGLDFISSGALIHQSTWLDIGLDWNHSTD